MKRQTKYALVAATLLVTSASSVYAADAATPVKAKKATHHARAAKKAAAPVAVAPVATAAPVVAAPAVAPVAEAPVNTGFEALYKDATIFGEARYRYEFVDQDGPAPVTNDANASTLRVNLGYKTGVYQGFQALIEGQVVQHIGGRFFNDSINGKTTYPAVTDPDVTVLNEFWLSNNSLPETVVKVGRQKINIDNQRFIGTVDWRQNDQTFDAVNVVNTSIKGLELYYAYLWDVNRIQGPDFATGQLNSDSHIAHASYKVADWLNITAYGYWMDFDNSTSLSNQTYGLRLAGTTPITEGWNFIYEAEGAKQYDYASSTLNYDEDYFHIVPGIKGHGLTVKGGLEFLGGNGTTGFQTPLATLHKFNGWADKFLTTPANGLMDYYGVVSYQLSGLHAYVDGVELTAAYHKYNGDKRGDFGSEADFSIGKSFKLTGTQPIKSVDFLIKFATYDAHDAPYTDTQKAWAQVGFKF